jgi:hypothetical protein
MLGKLQAPQTMLHLSWKVLQFGHLPLMPMLLGCVTVDGMAVWVLAS